MYEMKCAAGCEPRIIITDKFIEDNKLKIDLSVVSEVMSNKDDFFGFAKSVAINYIPIEDAKQYFNEEFLQKIEKGEAEHTQITDIKEAAQDFLDYMVFAWMKSEDQRGISASRSIEKLSAWLKLMSRNDLSVSIRQDALYNPYGAPALIEVCDKLGIKVPHSLIEFSKTKCTQGH